MGSLGTRAALNKLINKNSTSNLPDSATSLGVAKETVSEDKQFGDTVPCDEIDDFDTQVMDFNDETQPVDLGEETQIVDLADETQLMDDCDFIEHLDTQPLDVWESETEYTSNGEDAERTQTFHGSDEISDRCDDENTSNAENGTHIVYEDDSKARSEILPSSDTKQRSGSMRRGFTAIRTASLRAGGLAARRLSLTSADGGFCATEFSSESAKLHSLKDNDGRLNKDADVEHDSGKGNDKGLSNKNKCKVAKKLLMEEDAADGGSEDKLSTRRAEFFQLPASDNGLGELSYIESQEPGESSQANALEFVDKFLKINVFESDQDKTHENAVGENVSASAITKGPQSLAQQSNHRSCLAGASVFDWDDIHEDEGGGEFFIKKKDELLGTSSESRKCCTKPQSSRHDNISGSQLVGNLRKKEQQDGHDRMMGFVHSDSKLVNGRKVRQLEEINRKRKVDNYADQQLGLDSYDREQVAAAPNTELVDMLNVGIDTQIAAEAMEALSSGHALVTNGGSVTEQEKCKNEATKKLPKNNSVTKKSCLSKPVVGTRSKRTRQSTIRSGEESNCAIALRTRSQFVVREVNNGVVKSKGNQRRLDMKNMCSEKERDSSDVVPAKIVGKEGEGVLDQELNKNGSLLVKRRSLRGKIISSAPFSWKTRLQRPVNHLNDDGGGSRDFRAQRDSLDTVQAGRVKRKRSIKGDVASESLNATKVALNLTSVTDSMKVDTSSNRGGDVQHTPNQVNGSSNRQSLLLTSVGHEVVLQSIARRTRSKSSARCVGVPQKSKGLLSGDMLSVENPCQLSSQKHKSCSGAARETVSHLASEESPGEVKKSCSPANITPVKMKTPKSAVSPICAGDEYPTPSTKKVLKREFYRLSSSEHKHSPSFKDFRQRRDTSSIRVLFSQHLDEDIIRQQKKILSRLGVLEASSISDATHFVANVFVRTRNMLEAIANGKTVVTHLWLESCGQASCIIDEKHYILRDAKKEKELGFSMPTSLASASRRPLLEGRRVLITSNIKPGKEIISSLVKAVHGQAIERVCRSMSNKDRIPDDLLVLSCEEDFEECVPLLEKGIAVYSSELLLNGIINQRLEYERYCIFADHVKKTRSTLWVKKDGEQFLPVNKTK